MLYRVLILFVIKKLLISQYTKFYTKQLTSSALIYTEIDPSPPPTHTVGTGQFMLRAGRTHGHAPGTHDPRLPCLPPLGCVIGSVLSGLSGPPSHQVQTECLHLGPPYPPPPPAGGAARCMEHSGGGGRVAPRPGGAAHKREGKREAFSKTTSLKGQCLFPEIHHPLREKKL